MYDTRRNVEVIRIQYSSVTVDSFIQFPCIVVKYIELHH